MTKMNYVLKANLGTGRGYSVLEMVESFKEVSGKDIPYVIVGRRSGDISECYADNTLAKEVFDWSAQLDLNDMCGDAWNWQFKNPYGYN